MNDNRKPLIDVNRLEEIIDEMKELAKEALRLVNKTGERTWYANLICAIDSDHGYLDRSETLAGVVADLSSIDEEYDGAGWSSIDTTGAPEEQI